MADFRANWEKAIRQDWPREECDLLRDDSAGKWSIERVNASGKKISLVVGLTTIKSFFDPFGGEDPAVDSDARNGSWHFKDERVIAAMFKSFHPRWLVIGIKKLRKMNCIPQRFLATRPLVVHNRIWYRI
jgi:hypothetical protein